MFTALTVPRILLAASLAAWLAAPAPAQESAIPEDYEGVVPSVSATIDVKADGVAWVGLSSDHLSGDALGNPARVLSEAGCQLATSQAEADFRYDHGECTGWFRPRGLMMEGAVPLAPLVQAARAGGALYLTLTFIHPPSPEVRLTPAGDEGAYSPGPGYHYFVLPLESTAVPDSIQFSFGYRWSDLRTMALVLGTILLLPIALTLWMRRATLRLKTLDRAAAWFGYARFLQWASLGTFLAWWGASEILGVGGLADFLMLSLGFGVSIAYGYLAWVVPPIAVNVMCATLSQPVQAQVRGLDLTRSEVFWLALWAQAAIFVPLTCAIIGFSPRCCGSSPPA
jgi:hypothetical protein